MKASVISLLCFSTMALAGDADRDQKALQGTWEGAEGKKNTYVLTFEGNKWKLRDKNKEGLFLSGAYTLDAKPSPKEMNMKIEATGGGKDVEDLKGKTALAIYEISGDTLKWSAAEPSTEQRPTDFSGKGMTILVEFKRSKK